MTSPCEYFIHISSRADWDPVKTIFLCGPSDKCRTLADAGIFAKESGWLEEAEKEKCVLIVPAIPNGWENQSISLLPDLYNSLRNSVPGKQGRTIWGRKGLLWLWEIILHGAGYGDGAVYLGKVVLSHPGFFASCAMVEGFPTDLSAGNQPSNHWLVREVSSDYAVKNREIPVHICLYSDNLKQIPAVAEYWNTVNGTPFPGTEESIGGLSCLTFKNPDYPARQVRLFKAEPEYLSSPSAAHHILKECFQHVVRWKNSPDGTLALVDSREEFYHSNRYLRRTVGLNGNYYDYFVHLPKGRNSESCRNLPLVISVHGRGEPAWMYADKNGWETLADQNGEFITVTPDSPGNIWFRDRDAGFFPIMIQQMKEEFSIDENRIYLTGFSNGGTLTRELSLLYPEIFAAISPWNGPFIDSADMRTRDIPGLPVNLSSSIQEKAREFLSSKNKMPAFIIYGDKDPGISADSNALMPVYLEANGCTISETSDNPVGYQPDEIRNQENYYTAEAGYENGERFTTYVYYGSNGLTKSSDEPTPQVCVTIMKNMPHGAIWEESRAAWEFMKTKRKEMKS